MSETPEKGEKIHELAGGWITERAGTPVPLFLKLSYVFFCLFGIAYLFLWKTGETAHPTRGPQVLELNKVLSPVSGAMIAFVALLIVVYTVGLFVAAFRRGGRED